MLGWIFLFLSSVVLTTKGQCHNSCSGHGECNRHGQCECWSGYEGWNCSALSCPSAPAWTDLATATDDAHNSAVCSNIGFCDGSTGLCVCRKGFEGRACERMSCPNDCSGRGRCLSMAEAASANDGYRLTRTSSYTAWDADMIHGCVCDVGYGGYDCSLRHCSVSDSALTSGQQDESVILFCRCGDDCTNTFRLRYKGQYATIMPFLGEVEVADRLMLLPTIKSDADEYTTPPVSVAFAEGETTVCSVNGTKATITFAKDPGDLPPVYVKFNKLVSSEDAEVHMTTQATLVCTCKGVCSGHFRFISSGEATEKMPYNAAQGLMQTTLAGLSGLADANITVEAGGHSGGVCVDFSTVNTSIAVDLEFGNYPLKVVASLYDDGEQRDTIMTLASNDGTKEQDYCAGLGSCDFETGQCTCDDDYGYDQDYGPCGQYMFDHSHWTGRQMCPGFVLRPTIGVLASARNDWQLYFADAGLNQTNDYTEDTTFDPTVVSPGFYWYNEEDGGTDERILFMNATNATTDLSNALALDMTYRVLYFGQGNKVMRVTLPGDLNSDELYAAANATAHSPVETFVALEEGEAAGYLEMDLRPDRRYLYWTVPGIESEPDGKILRKRLSNDSDPTAYEDLSASIRSGMSTLGYELMDPLGIALDLRDQKIYFADAQVRGTSGGEDGVIIRCELDGSGVEIAASRNLSDPRALVLDVKEGILYLTDTHSPSLMRADMRNYTDQPITTILRGVTQERRGDLGIESYQRKLLNPQALQFDTRIESLSVLYFSDYETGYIYKVNTDGTNAEPFILMGQPKSFVFDLGEGYPTYTLYYDCHGHGVCSGAPYFTCTCDDGWEENCERRSCPQGPAWFDEAASDGSAHAYMECSARGHCDRSTGVCACHEGFTGNACQRMTCPDDCNGNGKCLSMRQLGLLALDSDLVPKPAVYGSISGDSLTWDADVVYGCYCDWMGYQGGSPSFTNLPDWTGYDCSRKTCPTGDDSKAAVYNATVFERQNVTCTIEDDLEGRENASFSISFRQGTTDRIGGNATVLDFEVALERLSTIGDVEVRKLEGDGESYPDEAASTTFCNSSHGHPASVVFKTELGNLPLLSVASSDGVTLSIAEATPGTKLNAECSGHGFCDYTKGECICFDGWASSDGNGAVGRRRDCGWHPGETGAVNPA